MHHDSTARNPPNQRWRPPDGFSLMEVIAAAALVGLMAVAAARPMRLAALGSLQAKTTARKLSLDLLRTRRMAIMTATPHQLMFRREGDEIVGYEVRRAGTDVQMDVAFPRHIAVYSPSDVEFRSTGEAVDGVEVQLQGKHSAGLRWKVVVARATGSVFVDSF